MNDWLSVVSIFVVIAGLSMAIYLAAGLLGIVH